MPNHTSLSASDHCRIGSLEIEMVLNQGDFTDHCRIGSLENERIIQHDKVTDHCRIGSLEMFKDYSF